MSVSQVTVDELTPESGSKCNNKYASLVTWNLIVALRYCCMLIEFFSAAAWWQKQLQVCLDCVWWKPWRQQTYGVWFLYHICSNIPCLQVPKVSQKSSTGDCNVRGFLLFFFCNYITWAVNLTAGATSTRALIHNSNTSYGTGSLWQHTGLSRVRFPLFIIYLHQKCTATYHYDAADCKKTKKELEELITSVDWGNHLKLRQACIFIICNGEKKTKTSAL